MKLFFNALLTLASCSLLQAAEKPNIMLILADDMGIECLSAYGGTSHQTPNLDRLAKEGKRFTHCFSNPLCSPSRGQLLTGRYMLNNKGELRRVVELWEEPAKPNENRDPGKKSAAREALQAAFDQLGE